MPALNKSKATALTPYLVEAEDGQLFIKLGTGSEGKRIFTNDLGFYLVARTNVSAEELADLTALIAAACDGLLCVIAEPHCLFKDLPPASFRVH